MKKILSTLFLCLAAIVVVSSVQTPAFAASYLTKYIKKTSNVYSSTSKNKKKLSTIAINTKVKVIPATKTMYRLTYKGRKGYIYKSNTSYSPKNVVLYMHRPLKIYNTNKTTKKVIYETAYVNDALNTKSPLDSDMVKVKYYIDDDIIEGYAYREQLYSKPLTLHFKFIKTTKAWKEVGKNTLEESKITFKKGFEFSNQDLYPNTMYTFKYKGSTYDIEADYVKRY